MFMQRSGDHQNIVDVVSAGDSMLYILCGWSIVCNQDNLGPVRASADQRGRFMRMTLHKGSGQSLVYSIQNAYRVVYAFFCLLTGIGLYVTVSEGTFNAASLVPVVLLLIALVGLTYRERWTFDPVAGTIESCFGFAVFVRCKTIRFDEVSAVEITHFVRGRSAGDSTAVGKGRNKAMVVFSIVTGNDTRHDVEIIGERVSAGRTESTARSIATAMGFPFHADREYDQVQQVTLRDL